MNRVPVDALNGAVATSADRFERSVAGQVDELMGPFAVRDRARAKVVADALAPLLRSSDPAEVRRGHRVIDSIMGRDESLASGAWSGAARRQAVALELIARLGDSDIAKLDPRTVAYLARSAAGAALATSSWNGQTMVFLVTERTSDTATAALGRLRTHAPRNLAFDVRAGVEERQTWRISIAHCIDDDCLGDARDDRSYQQSRR